MADAIIEYSKSYRTAPEKEGETGYRIAVLSTEQSTTRSYPYGAFASSVIGFCNNDENGKLVGAYGLENPTRKIWPVRRGAASLRPTSTAKFWPTPRPTSTTPSTATT